MINLKYLRTKFIWFKLSYPFRWAHHPTCDIYQNQRIDISFNNKHLSLCRGCTFLYFSTVLSMIINFTFFQESFSYLNYFGILLLSLGLVFYIDSKVINRKLKAIARIVIGYNFGLSLIILITTSDNIFRFVIFSTIIIFYHGYKSLRLIYPPANLCETCEYQPKIPYCPGMINKMEANHNFDSIVLPMYKDDFNNKIKNLSN